MESLKTKIKSKKENLPTNKFSNTKESQKKRLSFLESKYNINLSEIEKTDLNEDDIKGNIENFLGSVEVPLGVAGPLLFDHGEEKENIFLPMATSEGALIASVCRGAKAISLSGGVRVRTLKSVMTRCPLFITKNLQESLKVKRWINSHFQELREKCKDYSNYIELLNIKTKFISKGLAVKFEFDTGDAAGQNMSTVCTWNTCKWALKEIRERLDLREVDFIIESGWSSDKRVSSSATIEGRGKEVFAEAVIKKDVFKRVLRTDLDDYLYKLSAAQETVSLTSAHGFNINVANVIAASFVATGQDAACIHESSLGDLSFQKTSEGDLYISMHLPNLVLGTVGGGVSLPAQKKSLEIMNCYGAGKVNRLAEVIAGYCLALDLSTSTSIANGSFALAHERLGRNRTVDWVKMGEFNNLFFKEHSKIENQISDVIRDKAFSSEKSLVSDLVAPITKRVSGIFKYNLKSDGWNHEVVLKVKPKDQEVNLAFLMLAGLEDMELKEALNDYLPISLFNGGHKKEQEIYETFSEKFKNIFPHCYGTVSNDEREFYALILEYLRDYKFLDKESLSELNCFEFVDTAIEHITPFHAFNAEKSLPHIQQRPDSKKLTKLNKVWRKLLDYSQSVAPNIMTSDLYEDHRSIIDNIGSWEKKEENFVKTIIHGDFNTRNIGYSHKSKSIKVIDWEMASYDVPQRDIVELLSFSTDKNLNEDQLETIIFKNKTHFEKHFKKPVDLTVWVEAYLYAVEEFIIHRLPLYFIANAYKECDFLKDIYQQAHHIRKILKGVISE